MARPSDTKKDAFYARAKRESFVARSVYKLEELDKRFGLVRPGADVLDLGCAPGSWLQYLGARVGRSGRVLGVDLNPVRAALPPNVRAIVADIDTLTPDALRAELARVGEAPAAPGPDTAAPAAPGPDTAAPEGAPAAPHAGDARPFDLVVSDLAPHTTGLAWADAARSHALCEQALALALELLRPGGHFACKFFMGGGAEQLVAAVRPHFEKTRHAKPDSSRRESKEMYLVATGRKA